jgi:hypothetical protein
VPDTPAALFGDEPTTAVPRWVDPTPYTRAIKSDLLARRAQRHTTT